MYQIAIISKSMRTLYRVESALKVETACESIERNIDPCHSRVVSGYGR